tara:strand:+ start:38 stop:532 length:495 start_codon:yes stop_codon:yes gene_type:complete
MKTFDGTHRELAARLGMTERNLYIQLKKENSGIKKREDGLFLLENEEEDREAVIHFSEWRAKKMKEDALKSQREREMLEGKLLSREEVLSQLGAAFHTTKTSLLTIPTAIAGIVAVEDDANVCKEIIEGNIRETLIELQTQIARIGIAGNTDEATAEAGRRSMG